MLAIFKNSESYLNKEKTVGDFAFYNGRLVCLDSVDRSVIDGEDTVTFNNCLVLPGFCDVHVHFREPGFLYKEDIFTGSVSAAAGGYTDVCTMPNLSPVPDSVENLKAELDAIEQKAVIRVHPFGALTVSEAGETEADIEEMAGDVIGYSDDGRGVQSCDMMKSLMGRVAKVGKVLSAHCEDNSLLHGGYIHDGGYAKTHGHRGICSQSEWGPIARDVELAGETGVKYHVCHISTKESVDIIRRAKARGIDVTCETGPHYLILDDSNLCEDARFKMNPPLRDRTDREALVAGLLDGTIDMIATDHAPHSEEEKSRGLEKSLMGVVGLETAFAEMYTNFVKTEIITLERLLELMVYNPRERFGIKGDMGFSVWDVENETTVEPRLFFTKGRSTPFEGDRVYGTCLMTVCGGRIVYRNNTNGDKK